MAHHLGRFGEEESPDPDFVAPGAVAGAPAVRPPEGAVAGEVSEPRTVGGGLDWLDCVGTLPFGAPLGCPGLLVAGEVFSLTEGGTPAAAAEGAVVTPLSIAVGSPVPLF